MDVTDAISQEQVADSLVSEPEIDSTDTAGTEAVEQIEGEEQPLEQVEGEQGEEDADWLPSEQEKVFPPDVIAKYASRYGFTQEQLEANPSLLNLLHDKINSDILIRQKQSQPEFEQEPEETAQRPTQQPQPLSYQQWRQGAEQLAQQITSPEMAQAFAQGLQSCTRPDGSVDSMKLAQEFTVFGTNLINSLLPMYFQAPSHMEGKNMLQAMIESQYEGLGDLAQSSAYRNAWNSVRSAVPEFAKLAYGSDEFQQIMDKAEQALPGLQWMQFADKNGKPLSGKANAERQYQIAARLAQGQRPNPEMIKQAVQTGRSLARQTQVRKQAGNLGAGNSKQQFSQQTDDDFWSKPESWGQYLDRKL